VPRAWPDCRFVARGAVMPGLRTPGAPAGGSDSASRRVRTRASPQGCRAQRRCQSRAGDRPGPAHRPAPRRACPRRNGQPHNAPHRSPSRDRPGAAAAPRGARSRAHPRGGQQRAPGGAAGDRELVRAAGDGARFGERGLDRVVTPGSSGARPVIRRSVSVSLSSASATTRWLRRPWSLAASCLPRQGRGSRVPSASVFRRSPGRRGSTSSGSAQDRR
jgi:hypothetical protein